jgi:hypothetical protein
LFSVSQIDESIVVDIEEVNIVKVEEVDILEQSHGSAAQKPNCCPVQVSTRHQFQRSCSPSYFVHAK